MHNAKCLAHMHTYWSGVTIQALHCAFCIWHYWVLDLDTGRREPAVHGRPSAVRKENGPGDVAGRVGCEEQRRANHFCGRRPALEHGLGRIGVVPVRVVLDLCGQRCVDDAWSDGVHANTRGSELGGSRAHQLDGAGFCHGIDGLARFDDLRTYGRKQDDASGALLAHEATRGLNDVERTLEVEIENAIDLIRREFENRLSDVDAWGANHDIETP